MDNTNFFDPDRWRYSQTIKECHASLTKEFNQFPQTMWINNNQKYIGLEGGWYFIPFIGKSIRFEPFIEKCPTVKKLIDETPIFDNCTFSIMGPHSEIKPHKGHSDAHLRVHLSLITDGNAYIKVGNDIQYWREGEILIFQDFEEHSTCNPSNNTRVVFLFDIKREDYFNNIIG